MQQKTNRSRLISMIHMQKSTAHLTDDEYRVIVSGATGKQSCTDCTMTDLKAVFYDLNSVLEHKGMQRFFFKYRSQPTLQDAVLARAENVLGNDYKHRLDGLLTRIKAKTVETCSPKQLRQLMGILSTIEKENKHAAGTF